MTTRFLLTNLHCDACGKVCHLKLKKVAGVTAVRINQRGVEADGEVEADRTVPVAELQVALADTPYRVHAA